MSKTKIVIDTNVLIDNPEVLLDEQYDVYLPYVVLSELDGLKKNPDLNGPVRAAIKVIWELMKEDKVTITNVPSNYKTNDERIIKAAKQNGCAVLTGDVGAMAVAQVRHVEVIADEVVPYDKDFVGVTEVDIGYEMAANLIGINEMQIPEAEEIFGVKLAPNAYVHYADPADSSKFFMWKRTRLNKVELVRQTSKPYKDAGVMITAADPYQMAAMDAVWDNSVPLTIIEGALGCLVAGESINVVVTPMIVTKDVLYNHIQQATGASDQTITAKLKTLRKHKVVSSENDLTDFTPSLLPYFTLPKNQSIVFLSDSKYTSKYLHLRYWLSYYEFDTAKALAKVKVMRRHKKLLDSPRTIGEYKDTTTVVTRLIRDVPTDLIGAGRLSEAFSKDVL